MVFYRSGLQIVGDILMEKNIRVQQPASTGSDSQRLELVERKGIGHPDTLADGISEAVSRALCREYRDTFGAIAHHNTDEVQIIGGQSDPGYGGGEMIEPIYILLGGRATQQFDGTSVNVHGVAMNAARQYLRDTVDHLDVDQHVILDSRIKRGSPDLTEMYARESSVPLANDTSFGIGHAPLSDVEKLVLALEKELTAGRLAERFSFLGEDVKVMAYRDEDEINLTVAAAFVDVFVDDVDGYISRKQELRRAIERFADEKTGRTVSVAVNTADEPRNDSVYLTVTGTSAEMGDDGSTGRGNRVSGLITPKRPMSLEASSGKNPVAHVGKIYNILSHYIADQIVVEHDDVDEVSVKILSQIGKPVNEPQVADIQVDAGGERSGSLEDSIRSTTDYWLDNIPEIMEKVINGTITTY
jgi:S-adenosylmethionine synthetase